MDIKVENCARYRSVIREEQEKQERKRIRNEILKDTVTLIFIAVMFYFIAICLFVC